MEIIDPIFGVAEINVLVKKRFDKVKTEPYFLSEWLAGYIAGMIDGDGSITNRGINIYNNEIGMLLILQQFIGGKISGVKGRNVYTLNLRRAEQELLLPQIIPYLIIKKERAIKLFAKINK